MKSCTLLLAAALGASGMALSGPPAVAASDPKPPKLASSDYRTVDPENLLVIDTEKGRILVEMYPEIAPASVARVKALARAKFYDGLMFHRVVDDFMAQGGDPKGDGSGGSGQSLKGEFTFRRGPDLPYITAAAGNGYEDGFFKSMPVRTQSNDLMLMMADGKVPAWGLWCPGVAGMARAGDPDSADSQFFLMRQFNDQLEKKYTPWARVAEGEEVVRSLAVGQPPPKPDHMLTVRVMSDLPPAQQTKVQVPDTQSPGFKALLAYDKTLHGGSFSVCDVDLFAKP
ncbi:MAG TPA: peptidylprolyl isomerase [Caulobacteraceae bacterium]|nr:peptidylprolyl isomerase [Caulobacteraceae bacterium]